MEIRNIKFICSFNSCCQNGALYESGKHEELMEKHSLYYNLVIAQMNVKDSSEGDVDTSTSADEASDEKLSPVYV